MFKAVSTNVKLLERTNTHLAAAIRYLSTHLSSYLMFKAV